MNIYTLAHTYIYSEKGRYEKEIEDRNKRETHIRREISRCIDIYIQRYRGMNANKYLY